MRVLYSFPTRLGTPGIGTTAWHQVAGLAEHGVEVTLLCGSLERPLPPSVNVIETMRPAGVKLPYRVLGLTRAMRLHDRRAAAALRALRPEIDVLHAWPLGAERTLGVARRLGVPGLLERPNAHTGFAYAEVERASRSLGLEVDRSSPHHPDAARLAQEEREYALAHRLLCPSDFVARTFLDAGVDESKLLRHRYGYDPERFHARGRPPRSDGLEALFVGRGEPRKGLHLALSAWAESGAEVGGSFTVAGAIEPAYRAVLGPLLAEPGVREQGHVSDPAALMRAADVLVLPSLEEGSALVTYEARACGCVLVVSDRAGAVCTDGEDALVHPAGDVRALTAHLRAVTGDRQLLERLRAASLAGAPDLTWSRAAEVLAACYAAALAERPPAAAAPVAAV